MELRLLDQHPRMEEACLIEIDVHSIVLVQRLLFDKLLDGGHLAVHKQLAALQITRKAAHAIIHRDDVRVELTDEIVQRLQRCNLSAGRDVDIHAKGRNARIGMKLRIGMYGDVALVQMGKYRLPRQCCSVDGLLASRDNRCLLGDEHRHTRPLRLVVLLCNIQDPRTDHIGHLRKDLRETIGVVLLINVLDVVPLLTCRLRIANVINIETQRLRQVVKPVQFQLPIQRRSSFLVIHIYPLFFLEACSAFHALIHSSRSRKRLSIP